MLINKHPTWEKWINRQNTPSAKNVFLYWFENKAYLKQISINFKLNEFDMKSDLVNAYQEGRYQKFLQEISKINKKVSFTSQDAIILKKLLKNHRISLKEIISSIEYAVHSQGLTDAIILRATIINNVEKIEWYYNIKNIQDLKSAFKNNDDLIKLSEEIYIIHPTSINEEAIRKYAHPSWCLSVNRAEVARYYDDYDMLYVWVYNHNEKEFDYYGFNIETSIGLPTSSFNKYNKEDYSENLSTLLYDHILGKDKRIEYFLKIEKLAIPSIQKLIMSIKSLLSDDSIQYFIEKAVKESNVDDVIKEVRKSSNLIGNSRPSLFARFFKNFKQSHFYKAWINNMLSTTGMMYDLTDLELQSLFDEVYKLSDVKKSKKVNLYHRIVRSKNKRLFCHFLEKDKDIVRDHMITINVLDWLPDDEQTYILENLTKKDIDSINWVPVSKPAKDISFRYLIQKNLIGMDVLLENSSDIIHELKEQEKEALYLKMNAVSFAAVEYLFQTESRIIAEKITDHWIKNKKISLMSLTSFPDEKIDHYNDQIKKIYKSEDYIYHEWDLIEIIDLSQLPRFLNWYEPTKSFNLIVKKIIDDEYEWDMHDLLDIFNELKCEDKKDFFMESLSIILDYFDYKRFKNMVS